MNTIPTPQIDYFQVAPMLIVLGAAVIGVLAEAILPRRQRYLAQVAISFVGLLSALVMAVFVFKRLDPNSLSPKRGQVVAMGSLAIDGPTLFTWALVLIFGLLALMIFAERHLEGGVLAFAGQAAAMPGTEAEREASSRGLEHTEVFPLLLFAVGGMMMFPASTDMLALFVALEVFSLPLYLLCGLARRRRLLSQEAALKYFLLGAFSSAFFVYGISLVYGFAGSMSYAGIAQAVAGSSDSKVLLYGGLGLMVAGLLFKVGAVPFHNWTPDVYQGAPTAVTAFMAAGTKVAAFVALLRLMYVAFGAIHVNWAPMIWIVAILTMVIGSVVAVAQTDVKRLLAYSSVAHAGFILVGLLGIRALGEVGPQDADGVTAVLFYLTTYGFMTLAAFTIVTLVRDANGEATSMKHWAGLGKNSPLVAGVFAFLLLAMAGLPLTSGFTGKWVVFAAAMSAGAWPLVVVAVLISVVALVFYIRIIVVMFFADSEDNGVSVAIPSPLTSTVIMIGTAVTLALGLIPGPLLDLLSRVGVFIR
jgi:NADH-quinone oxidoreductase subunit N